MILDKDKVVKEYLPLIAKIARDLKATLPYNVEVDDLIQEGVIALIQATEKFNPAVGATFKTYAYNRIKGAMLDYLRKLDFLPKNVRHDIKRLEQEVIRFYESNLRFPTFEELAALLNVSVDEAKSVYNELQMKQFFYIDQYFFDLTGEGTVELQLQSQDDVRENVKKSLLYERLKEAINNLEEREKIILSLRFEHELSLKEISEVFGISESRVSQILSLIFAKLRRMLEE